jgi:hypothetical protein
MGSDAMAGTEVTREQFQILKTTWSALPRVRASTPISDARRLRPRTWAELADRLENGDDYRAEDVRVMAAQLLRERKQA